MSTMDMRRLKYFLTIAQEGQITRAAKLLNMEQPPLSRQLKLMEEELGRTAVRPNRQTLEANRCRRAAEAEGRRCFCSLMKLSGVKEREEGVRGVLSIGSVVSCISLLPQRIERYRKRFPEVTFKILRRGSFLLRGTAGETHH